MNWRWNNWPWSPPPENEASEPLESAVAMYERCVSSPNLNHEFPHGGYVGYLERSVVRLRAGRDDFMHRWHAAMKQGDDRINHLAGLSATQEYHAHILDHTKNARIEGLEHIHGMALWTMDSRTRARYRKRLEKENMGTDKILDRVEEQKALL
jgi:hypothetical protein